ncbi:DcaP family trimeric outer membrane transporter [Solimonas marina]|uniref:Porin n=1 Tax=Solimonas marina TaxID=2714601 RepID=A0A970BB82_9GAMM|nr:DcaP family trimeric outer membrane transporter [Solimonas marina]NKF24126.1 hypothetical protein [Solimonas marina]
MKKARKVFAKSLIAISVAALSPAIAHADDTQDVRAQLQALSTVVKNMQLQQQAMQQHEQDLEKRLAASESARAALAAQVAQQAKAPAAGAAGGGALAAQGAAPLPAQAQVPVATNSGEPVAAHSTAQQSMAAADMQHAPPGTLGVNPVLADSALPAGKGASILIPGTNTRFTFGGMIKVDAYDDISGANLNTVPTDAVSIPIDGTSQADRKGQFMMTARQTRFNVGSETPTDWGALRSFIDIDFYGTGGTGLITNPVSPRLRHAYLSLGGLTIGQTWSVFFDLAAAPETLDMTGPVGNSYAIRQPLVRYQTSIGQHGQMTFGVENADGDFLGADQTSNFPIGSTLSTRVLNKLPDFTARYTYSSGPLRLSAAGVVRYLNLDTGGASLAFEGHDGTFNFAGQDSTWAFGGQLDMKVKTWNSDSFMLGLNGGPGIGRYLMAPQDAAFAKGVAPNGATNSNPGNGAVLGPDGKLRPIFSWGAVASYRHIWSTTLRSNLTLGYQHVGDPDGTLPVNFPEELTSLHANLIWSPLPQVGFGMEYVRETLSLRGQTDANRELGYGDSGSMNRIQLTAQYNLF